MPKKSPTPKPVKVEATPVEETTAVVEHQPQTIQPADNSVEGFIAAAIQEKLPVETIKEFLAMRKELKADAAREAYVRDMAKLQSELPTIKKKKANTGTSSKYAPLEDIIAQVKTIIANNHFSYTWNTKTTDKTIEVDCIATHVDGHSQSSTMVSEIAEGTKVNSAPQKAAITITYLKRYTFCNLFGIVVADEDMDDRIKTPEDLEAEKKAKIDALDITMELKTIEGAKDLAELKRYWTGFSPALRENETLLEAKDKRKVELEQDASGSESQ